MAHCLSDAAFGYYRRARLGEDFITAPMLGNLLGLVVGRWLVACWRRLGCPREVMLVEAGAGGGELLGDVLGVVRKLAPESLDALTLHVVEINEGGRERLAQVVSRFGVRELRIHETLEEVPRGCWLFLANEFFDALPIRQYLWSGGRSFVRRIALDERRGGAALRFVQGEPCRVPRGFWQNSQDLQDSLVPSDEGNIQEGSVQEEPIQEGGIQEGDVQEERIVEVSPRALFLAATVANTLAENGGAALVCDYGYRAQRFAPRGGSLQAFYRHKAVDPLTHIGACDLSAEVDFGALSKIFAAAVGEGGECCLQTQRDFLRAAGVVSDTVSNCTPKDAQKDAPKDVPKDAQSIVRRLIDDEAMGTKFKVLTAFAPQPA